MILYVSHSDLACGRRRNPYCCPVALAIKRRVKSDFTSVHVGERSISIEANKPFNRKYVVLTLPKNILNYIKRIDEGKIVEPRTFVLDVPKEFLI